MFYLYVRHPPLTSITAVYTEECLDGVYHVNSSDQVYESREE